MKKMTILWVLLLWLPVLLVAQSRVKCPSCLGSGGMQTMAGFMPCLQCMGNGTITNPNSVNQSAAKRGMADGLCMRGKIELAQGNYDEAFEFLRKAFKNNSREAIFYLGACLELGIGIDVNRDLAKRLYDVGQEMNIADCVDAVRRINTSGFWDANDNMREKFRRILSNLMNVSADPGNVTNSGVNSNPSSSSSPGRTCPYCNGTGSGPDQITYSPNYSGKNETVYCSKCRKYMSPHTHHVPICRVCNGRKVIK